MIYVTDLRGEKLMTWAIQSSSNRAHIYRHCLKIVRNTSLEPEFQAFSLALRITETLVLGVSGNQ